MHIQPPWVNKLLFSPVVKNKRKESLMTDCLAALVKHVAELCQAGLEVCHYIEEFHFLTDSPPWSSKDPSIRMPVDRMADPSHDPLEGNIFVLYLRY
jgi:hypothetical protein